MDTSRSIPKAAMEMMNNCPPLLEVGHEVVVDASSRLVVSLQLDLRGRGMGVGKMSPFAVRLQGFTEFLVKDRLGEQVVLTEAMEG